MKLAEILRTYSVRIREHNDMKRNKKPELDPFFMVCLIGLSFAFLLWMNMIFCELP